MDLSRYFLLLRIPVGKRSNFTKRQSRGLFPGARVTRGRDWKWGDQDGGGGHVGQLTEITSWNGVERAGANVMWSLLSRNTYRTGHMGQVRFGKLMPSTGSGSGDPESAFPNLFVLFIFFIYLPFRSVARH